MIHVTTNGGDNGLFQSFLPENTGPDHAIGSAWIYVISGQVGIGTGNDGAIGFDALTVTMGQWEFLQAGNGVPPANEFIIYAYGGGHFYAENANVSPVPLPAAFLFLAPGLAAFTAVRRGLTG